MSTLSGGVGIGWWCSSPYRHRRPSSRTTASSALAPRSSRASSSNAARSSRWVSISGKAHAIYDRERDEVSYGRVPARLVVVVSGNLPAENGKVQPLLCSDRQARRREDTQQGRNQRAAASGAMSDLPPPVHALRHQCLRHRQKGRGAGWTSTDRAVSLSRSRKGGLRSRINWCTGATWSAGETLLNRRGTTWRKHRCRAGASRLIEHRLSRADGGTAQHHQAPGGARR